VGRGGSGTTTVADGGGAATTAVGAKSGPFPSIGIAGRQQNWSVGTISHGRVRNAARRMAELWRAHGHGKLGQGVGFVLIHLHGEVRGIKAKLDDLVSSRELDGVGRDVHGTAVARARGRTGVAR